MLSARSKYSFRTLAWETASAVSALSRSACTAARPDVTVLTIAAPSNMTPSTAVTTPGIRRRTPARGRIRPS